MSDGQRIGLAKANWSRLVARGPSATASQREARVRWGQELLAAGLDLESVWRHHLQCARERREQAIATVARLRDAIDQGVGLTDADRKAFHSAQETAARDVPDDALYGAAMDEDAGALARSRSSTAAGRSRLAVVALGATSIVAASIVLATARAAWSWVRELRERKGTEQAGDEPADESDDVARGTNVVPFAFAGGF